MEQQAVCLAPEEAVFSMTVGLILYYQGQYETSLQEYRKTLDRHPKFSTVHYYAGKSHQEMKHYDEAERYYLEDLKRSPERPLVLATLGNLYAIRGERGKARDILDSLHALSGKRYVSPYHYAIVEVGLGNHRSALKWLEQAENEKAFRIATTAVEPLLNPIRTEPGFQALLSRVGLAIPE